MYQECGAGREKGQARSQLLCRLSRNVPECLPRRFPVVRQTEGADSGRAQGRGPEQAKGQAGGFRWRQSKQRVSGQDRSPGGSSALGASVSLTVTWWREGHALIGPHFHGVTLGKCQACLCLNFFIC